VLAAFTKNVRPSVQATYDAATTAFINAHGSFSASDGSPVMAKSGTATIVITPGPIPPRQTATVPASTAADINAYNAFANAQSNFNAAATGVQILDASSALTSINAIDNASEEVDTEQAQQGALENRLNSVISSLQSSDDSQTAARSRIMDTDYAAETSSLARNQILEKAGFALLTQANQQTASVLSLLH
jgi:flagellin